MWVSASRLENRTTDKKGFVLFHSILFDFFCTQESNKTKFFFDTPNACMIFSKGEMTLIEYGTNTILERIR